MNIREKYLPLIAELFQGSRMVCIIKKDRQDDHKDHLALELIH